MNEIRTRFAPSPTGLLHIGSLRTALYAYAFAKSKKGDFILRIEDTDQRRNVAGAKEKIGGMLKLFGIVWDEYYIQSERLDLYREAAKKLLAEGHAFYCQCQARNAKKEGYSKELRDPCRGKNLTSGAIKLKVPDNERISFCDFVVGKEISWESSAVADATLLKSDGFPTYHLAAVVDDHGMRISHVFRGHDWMPSTPIHLLVYRYLGFEPPQIGHLTDILDPEGGKLSKRKGSVSCEEFLTQGFLPEAILNFIMLLGWAPKDNREIFTLPDFVANFQKGSLQVANPIFNRQKLDWFNGHYLRQKSDADLLQSIKPFAPKGAAADLIAKTIPLIKDRITKLSDYEPFAGFFFAEPKVDKKLLTALAKEQLTKAISVLEKITDWKKAEIEKQLQGLVKKENWQMGEFFMNFRLAIAGSKFTPPITDSVAIMGRAKTLPRLKLVLELL